jgi:phospho-N-acetylmuramoyl-pentapeptide-transferase
MANCVNFTDGLDGLAAGTVSLYLLFFALCALVLGDVVMLLVLSALLGALLGFLWHNGHPARVFMGDVGALSLGGLLGLVVLMMRLELLIPIACVILVAEGGSVILQVLGWRLLGRRIFYLAPLHHHFEKKGIPELRIVNRFILLSVISTTCAGLVFMHFFLGNV